MFTLNRLRDFLRSIFFMYNWDYGVLILFLFMVSVIGIAFKNLIRNKKIVNSVILALFIIYFGLILYATLLDRHSSPEKYGHCFIPFYSYYQFFHGNKDIMQQAIMNIAFFYPFGFLLSGLDVPFLQKRKWLIIIFALTFSLCIETLQYLFHLGYAELDDIIHNTLGAAIGVLAFVLLDKLFVRIKKQHKQRIQI